MTTGSFTIDPAQEHKLRRAALVGYGRARFLAYPQYADHFGDDWKLARAAKTLYSRHRYTFVGKGEYILVKQDNATDFTMFSMQADFVQIGREDFSYVDMDEKPVTVHYKEIR